MGVVAGGCTERLQADGETEATTATAVENHEFTRSRTTRREQTTDVSFGRTNDRVTIEGTMLVGSSSCYEAALDHLEYDGGVLKVRVHAAFVGREYEDGARQCTTDIVWEEYELTVRFEDGLPDRVEVTVGDGHGETETVVEER